MPPPFNPAVPHRNFIKALMLAGVPITDPDGKCTCICNIMIEYGYNQLTTDKYNEIKDELLEIPGANKMLTVNTSIYDANGKAANKARPQSMYIDDSVTGQFMFPEIVTDIIGYWTGTKYQLSRNGNRVIHILNNKIVRQNIEVLLLQGQTPWTVCEIMGADKKNSPYMTIDAIRAYKEFFWAVSITGYNHGGMTEIVNYLSINHANKMYDPHRRYMYLPMEEVLAGIGYMSDDGRNVINRRIYGKAAIDVLTALRDGVRAKDQTVKIYMHADASISEDKKNTSMDDVRKRMADIFENMDTVAEKRRTMAEVINRDEEEEPEEDKPKVFKR